MKVVIMCRMELGLRNKVGREKKEADQGDLSIMQNSGKMKKKNGMVM